jgi:hypothetical protein
MTADDLARIHDHLYLIEAFVIFGLGWMMRKSQRFRTSYALLLASGFIFGSTIISIIRRLVG